MKISDNILSLIIKNLSYQSSEDEEKTLNAWLEESNDNHNEFEKIKRIWNSSEAPLGYKLDLNAQWSTFKANTFDKEANDNPVRALYTGNHSRGWYKYAAAAVIFIGIFLSGIWFYGSDSYTTQANQRLLVALADGTEITLGANSNLTVPRTFNWTTRDLTLNGEGFFKIAKNPNKVFTIQGSKTNTQILGTAFRLKATDSENSIDVAEGKVAYWANNLSDTLILTVGESGSFYEGVLAEETFTTKQQSAWFTGAFSFNEVPLSQVLSELQNHYGFSLKFEASEKVSICAFSGTFDQQTRDEVIEELALAMNFSYTWENNTLIIQEIECN